MIKHYLLPVLTILLFISCSQNRTATNSPATSKAEIVVPDPITVNSPAEAVNALKAGNMRFMNDNLIYTHYKHQIEATKDDQHPHSVILSCLDSRVPPEIIFDQGIGNIFVARVAGNIENEDILGSMEFATALKNTKLIMVLGHENCGAVKGAIQDAELGHLTQLVNAIKPAIPDEQETSAPLLEEATKNNVVLTMADILERSPVISDLVKSGKVGIVGAYYDLTTGRVEFMD